MAGGTIERSCYSPHYVNTERDYERDYQATLPQGRTAADGCKPRHGRDDRKRERSFSGLRGTPSLREVRAEGWSELSPRCVGAAARRAGLSPFFCDAPISRRPVCFLMHTLPPFGPAELGGFFLLEWLRGGTCPREGRARAAPQPVPRWPTAFSGGERGFSPLEGGGPHAHHVRRRSPTHLRHRGH